MKSYSGYRVLDARGNPVRTVVTVHEEGKVTPLDLFVMLDKSSSEVGTKWDAAKAGLEAFVGDPKSGGVRAALGFFPRHADATPACDQNAYAAPKGNQRPSEKGDEIALLDSTQIVNNQMKVLWRQVVVQAKPDPNKPDKAYGADTTGTLICIFPVSDLTVFQANLKFNDQKYVELETDKNLLPKEGAAAVATSACPEAGTATSTISASAIWSATPIAPCRACARRCPLPPAIEK